MSAPDFDSFTWRAMNPTREQQEAEIARRHRLEPGDFEVVVVNHD